MGLIRSEGIAEFRDHLDTYSARDLSLCTANTMSSDETLSIKNEYVKAPRSNLIKIFYFDSIGGCLRPRSKKSGVKLRRGTNHKRGRHLISCDCADKTSANVLMNVSL